MIITEEHRRAAKEPKAKKSMTPAQIERLRQAAEEDRLSRIGECRFTKAVAGIETTPENLQNLIARCSGDPTNLERRTAKLLYWIQAKGHRLGFEITTPSQITFLSNLTSDEIQMSDSRFSSEWKVKKVFKHPDPVVPGEKRCDNKWCRKGPDKTRGICIGKRRYCSSLCRSVCFVPKSRPETLAESQNSGAAS